VGRKKIHDDPCYIGCVIERDKLEVLRRIQSEQKKSASELLRDALTLYVKLSNVKRRFGFR